jgi:hypothetical protein
MSLASKQARTRRRRERTPGELAAAGEARAEEERAWQSLRRRSVVRRRRVYLFLIVVGLYPLLRLLDAGRMQYTTVYGLRASTVVSVAVYLFLLALVLFFPRRLGLMEPREGAGPRPTRSPAAPASDRS